MAKNITNKLVEGKYQKNMSQIFRGSGSSLAYARGHRKRILRDDDS